MPAAADCGRSGTAPAALPVKRILPSAAALTFIAFFIAIVIIADRGEGDHWWGFIHLIPNGDKVGHVVLVGTLSLLCNLAVPSRRTRAFFTRTTLVLLLLLTLEEIAQAFLPSRTCDIFDWLADLAGLSLGQLAATSLHGRFFRSR
jgi:hypothetical protein